MLDNLKGVWKNQKESAIQFSEIDIYKMIHKKSTSLVKWIFYISIIEFVLFMLPNFLIDNPEIEKLHLLSFMNISIAVSLVIGLIFMYLFYKNYKRICVSDSAKKLMADILKTKKTVNYYIIIQIIIVSVLVTIISYRVIITLEETKGLELTSKFGIWLLIIFMTLFIIAIFWFFYKFLYGILLNKLKDNYKELQKND
ncbi:MAG: hypothetical protein L3J23_01175 [Flavobacteriaceae bacterium]|nr:hypothetical protein [Flavobacteriaceae bacterium]